MGIVFETPTLVHALRYQLIATLPIADPHALKHICWGFNMFKAKQRTNFLYFQHTFDSDVECLI